MTFCSKLIISNTGMIIGNKIWLCSDAIGVLLCIDLPSSTLEEFYCIPEASQRSQAVGGMIKNEDDLYLIPYNMEYLVRFTISNKTFRVIDIINDETKKVNYKYARGFLYNDKLFLIGQQGSQNILVYDVVTERVIKTIDYRKLIKDEEFVWINNLSTYVIEDNYAYLNVMGIGAILSINLDTYHTELLKIDSSELKDGVMALTECGDGTIAVSGVHGEIALWNPSNNSIEKYCKGDCNGGYQLLISIENKIICIPLYETEIDVIEKNKKKNIHVEYKNKENIKWKYRFTDKYKDIIVIQSGYSGEFYFVDYQHGEAENIDLMISEEIGKRIYKIAIEEMPISTEGERLNLSGFLNGLTLEDN